MKNIKIIFILISIISCKLHSKEVTFEVYDTNIKSDIQVVVDPVAGQYRIDLNKYFKPKFTTEYKQKELCEYLEETVEENMDLPDMLLSDYISRDIKWQIFKNYRDLSHLEPLIKKLLKKRGYDTDQLTNITDMIIYELKVNQIIYDEDAITLKSDYLEINADKEIKRILEENSFRAHEDGSFVFKPELDTIYCDLVRGFVTIDFELNSKQKDYIDDNISPLDSLLTPTQVDRVSKNLNKHRQLIVRNTEKLNDNVKVNQARTILSSIYLSQEIENEGISIDNLVNGEFFDISTALINKDSGLPSQISSQEATDIARKTVRGAKLPLSIPMQHKGKFELEGTSND